MPNAKNIATMDAIKADLEGVQAIWVVDYRGLTVAESQQLRRTIRQTGAVMKVYKNTLVHRALVELGMASMDEILEGPSAFVFANEDPVAAVKALKDYAKTNQNLSIKGGIMDNAFLTAEEAIAVASLPSKEQLMGQVAGAIAGMARGLAVSINGIASGLARATAAVAEQKPAA